MHEYEMSAHAKKGVTCLDCHQPAPNQKTVDHRGFVISAHLTAGNCRSCHEGIYEEFLRSGFLIIPLVLPVTRRFLDLCVLVMFAQAFVGVLGFWYHMRGNLLEPGHNLFDKLVNGAPPMAPLLFPNLVGLALIGMWALIPHLPEGVTGRSWLDSAYGWIHSIDEEEFATD